MACASARSRSVTREDRHHGHGATTRDSDNEHVRRSVLVEIGATSCGPCNAMDAILKTLVAEGMPIKRINTDQNAALVDRWQIKGTPTFVMLVDAKEVSRSIGALDVGQLRGWYKATQDWSRKLKGESP